jgi:hypothetical protein
MTQWHPRQWCLWLMVAAVMVVVAVNCAAAVDTAATIPSLAMMPVAKTTLPQPPLTAASIDNNCYCCRGQLPSLLPYS